jgi:hypothetical protein
MTHQEGSGLSLGEKNIMCSQLILCCRDTACKLRLNARRSSVYCQKAIRILCRCFVSASANVRLFHVPSPCRFLDSHSCVLVAWFEQDTVNSVPVVLVTMRGVDPCPQTRSDGRDDQGPCTRISRGSPGL